MAGIGQEKRLAQTGDLFGRMLFGCGALMMLTITWKALSHLMKETDPKSFAVGYVAVGWILTAGLALLGLGLGRLSEGKFCALLVLTALVVRCGVAIVVDTQPVSDFKLLYDAARELAQGNNIMNDSQYFQLWSYQSAFVAWMALLIRLFGNNLLVLKLSNALLSSLCVLLAYILTRRFASRQGAGGAALLYLFYPGSWLLVPVLTNQHLSELLLLAAIYVYTARAGRWKKKLALAAGAGALLALSNAIRPCVAVAVLAVGVAMVLDLLERRPDRGKARVILARGLLVLAVYGALGAGLSGLTRVTGLNRGGLENHLPQWKFVVGLNQERSGRYSPKDDQIVFGSEDPERAAEQLVQQRLQVPAGELLDLVDRKVSLMWGGFEETVWTVTDRVKEDLQEAGVDSQRLLSRGQRLSAGFYLGIFLLAAVGCLAALWGTGRQSDAARILVLTALAYFCVHFVIEIQTRYRSLMLAVAFPMAAFGIDWLRGLWRRRGAALRAAPPTPSL